MKKNNIPKVSAIVPVYKVPKLFFEKCVDSLINQTLKEIEIILVDDGSPDDCGRLCDEYAKKDKRIKVIHQDNKGLCGARNTGVKAATGEWISFIDGDDYIDLNTYEVLYNSTENNDLDVVMFGYEKDYPSKRVIMEYKKNFEDNKIYSSPEEIKYLQMMILNYNANCAMAPTKFINRNFITENNIYHDDILRQGAEGIEFNIRLFANAKRVKFINKCFYHYVYNDESITTVHNEKNHQMVLKCFEKIKSEIDTDNNELMNWFYDRVCCAIATTAISGYFSPSNQEKYSEKKRKFKKYMQNELVKETLQNYNYTHLGKQRKIIMFLIENRLYLLLSLLAKVRNYQKRK